jgi:hypothetical protein
LDQAVDQDAVVYVEERLAALAAQPPPEPAQDAPRVEP